MDTAAWIKEIAYELYRMDMHNKVTKKQTQTNIKEQLKQQLNNSVLVRPFWSGVHHLVCLVHHLVSSTLGLNSNYDIHSTIQINYHLTQAIQCIHKDHL